MRCPAVSMMVLLSRGQGSECHECCKGPALVTAALALWTLKLKGHPAVRNLDGISLRRFAVAGTGPTLASRGLTQSASVETRPVLCVPFPTTSAAKLEPPEAAATGILRTTVECLCLLAEGTHIARFRFLSRSAHCLRTCRPRCLKKLSPHPSKQTRKLGRSEAFARRMFLTAKQHLCQSLYRILRTVATPAPAYRPPWGEWVPPPR